MAMGKRKRRQESLFIMADCLPRSDGHPFYQKLNALLAEADFDRWIEARCRPFYEQVETACLAYAPCHRRFLAAVNNHRLSAELRWP